MLAYTIMGCSVSLAIPGIHSEYGLCENYWNSEREKNWKIYGFYHHNWIWFISGISSSNAECGQREADSSEWGRELKKHLRKPAELWAVEWLRTDGAYNGNESDSDNDDIVSGISIWFIAGRYRFVVLLVLECRPIYGIIFAESPHDRLLFILVNVT